MIEPKVVYDLLADTLHRDASPDDVIVVGARRDSAGSNGLLIGSIG